MMQTHVMDEESVKIPEMANTVQEVNKGLFRKAAAAAKTLQPEYALNHNAITADMAKSQKQSIAAVNTEEMRIGGSNSFMESVV